MATAAQPTGPPEGYGPVQHSPINPMPQEKPQVQYSTPPPGFQQYVPTQQNQQEFVHPYRPPSPPIDLSMLMQGQENIVKTLESSMVDMRTKVTADIRNAVIEVAKHFDNKCSILENQVEFLKNEVEVLKAEKENWSYKQQPCDIENITVMIGGLEEDDHEDLDRKVDDMIAYLAHGNPDIPKVLQTKRLRSKIPGKKTEGHVVVKAAFASLAEKLQILALASDNDGPYKDVFMWPSRPHSERTAEKNMKVLLDELKLWHKFKLTGHGLVVLRDDPRYKPREGAKNKFPRRRPRNNKKQQQRPQNDRNAGTQHNNVDMPEGNGNQPEVHRVHNYTYDRRTLSSPLNPYAPSAEDYPPVERSPVPSETHTASGVRNTENIPKLVGRGRARGRAQFLASRMAARNPDFRDEDRPGHDTNYQGGYNQRPVVNSYWSQFHDIVNGGQCSKIDRDWTLPGAMISVS